MSGQFNLMQRRSFLTILDVEIMPDVYPLVYNLQKNITKANKRMCKNYYNIRSRSLSYLFVDR